MSEQLNKPIFTGSHSNLVLTSGDIKVYWRDLGNAGMALVCERAVPNTARFWQPPNSRTEIINSCIYFDTRYEVNNLTPEYHAEKLIKFMELALEEEKKWKGLNHE